MLKRYLVFAYDQHYPRGGWLDFYDSARTIDEAMVLVAQAKRDHWHIVDSDTGRIYRRD